MQNRRTTGDICWRRQVKNPGYFPVREGWVDVHATRCGDLNL